jgi:septum formation protein
MQLSVPLILASASPRRKHLLTAMGLSPVIQPADVDERMEPSEKPVEMVKRLALTKANAVAPEFPEALVLGSDTTVVLDGAVLGKPGSPENAIFMLRQLSGRTHQVISSVGLVHHASGRTAVDAQVTEVTFDQLTTHQIARYVEGGSPMDKAGAYGIQDDQGAFFVRHISGDYYTVMGLPLNMMYHLVRGAFPDLVSD